MKCVVTEREDEENLDSCHILLQTQEWNRIDQRWCFGNGHTEEKRQENVTINNIHRLLKGTCRPRDGRPKDGSGNYWELKTDEYMKPLINVRTCLKKWNYHYRDNFTAPTSYQKLSIRRYMLYFLLCICRYLFLFTNQPGLLNTIVLWFTYHELKPASMHAFVYAVTAVWNALSIIVTSKTWLSSL